MSSFQRYGPPSLVLSDGLVTVPLWAVTSLDLSRSYEHARGGAAAVKDTVVVAGLLVGPERFAWRAALETLAARDSGTGPFTADPRAAAAGDDLPGVTLLAESTIRTDLRIVSLSFAERAERREVVETTLTLAHAPQWRGGLVEAVDLAVAGLSALADWEPGRGRAARNQEARTEKEPR